jgi:plastocyanin
LTSHLDHTLIVVMTRYLFALLAMLGSMTACAKSTSAPPADRSSTITTEAPAAKPTHVVRVKATKTGFEPAEITLKQGEPSAIEFERVTESKCMRAVRMPWMKKAKDLAVGEKVLVPIPTDKSGRFAYACWMNMLYGRVTVEASK